MTIVSFELRDKPQFSVHIEGVMQPERSTQLTHTQMPLQRFGVLWKGESLVSRLAEGNRLTQMINELKCWGEKRVSEQNASVHKSQFDITAVNRFYLNVLISREQVQVYF